MTDERIAVLEKQLAEAKEARRKEIYERLRALEQVVEAAQKFLGTIDLAERTGARVNMPPVQWQALFKLREAVKNNTQSHAHKK